MPGKCGAGWVSGVRVWYPLMLLALGFHRNDMEIWYGVEVCLVAEKMREETRNQNGILLSSTLYSYLVQFR